LGPLGSVRGAFSNERPYREHIKSGNRRLSAPAPDRRKPGTPRPKSPPCGGQFVLNNK